MAKNPRSVVYTLDPVVETGAYASGDLIGEKLTLTNVMENDFNTAVLLSVTVGDQAKQNSALDLIFWAEDPATGTFTDNAALDVDDADLDLIVAVVSVGAGDYVDFSDNSIAFIGGINQIIQASGDDNANLYLAIVSRGTPTYVATGDIRIKVGLLLD